MFTKEHYEEVAKAIKACREVFRSDAHMRGGVDYVAGYLSYTFSKDNPNFDPEKFAEACGIKTV